MADWLSHDAELVTGGGFDLDFHTIAYHDDDAFMESLYVSKRSRRQSGILPLSPGMTRRGCSAMAMSGCGSPTRTMRSCVLPNTGANTPVGGCANWCLSPD